jgi:hypothetical protein
LSVVYVVCCQVEVCATNCPLVQRSPTDCGASLCVIKKPRERGGHSPRWAAEPEKIINKKIIFLFSTFPFPALPHHDGRTTLPSPPAPLFAAAPHAPRSQRKRASPHCLETSRPVKGGFAVINLYVSELVSQCTD